MNYDPDSDLQTRLDWAVTIAREAGDLTLEYFRSSTLTVELKADVSPVTAADRAAEQLLRKRIAERFPHDGILGEEFGESSGSSAYQWVLDPIDGTKSFIHGVPLYTTLVAVLAEDQPMLGVIYAPACDEIIYAAAGRGCWYRDIRRGGTTAIRAQVSRTKNLGDALLLTTEVAAFTKSRREDALPIYLDLERKARLARTWGDAYGYLMVATGRADVMIDPVMNLWDAAPIQPILEEAGGSFTDWQGRVTVQSGEGIATNGLLTQEVLAIVQGQS
jgi:histidinol phosphatase-like enzyme (inositol monophosphatase family)